MCWAYRTSYSNMVHVIIIIIIIMFGAVIQSVSSVEAVSYIPNCHQSERQALLSFKQHLTDPSDRLSSWVAGGISCCGWHGVVCDNLTGHVLELHLRGPFSKYDYYHPDGQFYGSNQISKLPWLGGKLDNSLLDLKHLRYLDLSNNDFGGIQVPLFVGSMHTLTCLNLSGAGFGGEIPSQLGNLSNLLSLAITDDADYGIHTKNLGWLSGLSMLRYLDLSQVMLPKTLDALQGISALPLLEELHLQYCGLEDISHFPNLVNVNFSNLVTLDLFYNEIGSFPGGLENITSLKYLDLSSCSINSTFPNWLYKFSQLEKLMLGGNDLRGTIADNIANLTFLNHLDLSDSDLEGEIPRSIRTMCKLELFDLSHSRIGGKVSEVLSTFTGCASNRLHSISFSGCELHGSLSFEIGQFQNLEQLDLSKNIISGLIPHSLGSLNSLLGLYLSSNQLNGSLPQALGQLHRLEYLDLSNNSLSGAIPDSIGSLNSLVSLKFFSNQLNGALPQALGQLHRLEYLDLRHNSISGLIPDFIGSLNSLVKLDFSSNQLNGTLPQNVFQLHGLRYLSLDNNLICGAIPESLGSLSSLITLTLSGNKFSGTLPSSLGKLIQLETLDVSSNSFEGLLLPIFFANLTRPRNLYASANRIQVSPDWIPPLELEIVHLSSCYLGPKFPKWLSSLDHLSVLDISNAGINDTVPSWFWNMTSKIESLNMSHNHLHGEISSIAEYLDTLDLSNNSFSCNISSLICATKNDVKWLENLHLGNNNLFGEIPDCLSNWPYLVSIELQNNNLTGSLPKSLGSLNSLQYLHLRNNSLSGVLPSSLENCTELMLIDIADNKLCGRLPKLIGQRLSNIRILSLSSNYFDGHVPNELCALSFLIILDMAHNNLSGGIPDCLANFSAMTKQSISDFTTFNLPEFVGDDSVSFYGEAAVLVTKALLLEYTKNLRFMTAIDLSNNILSGPIPEGITNLVALRSLNLSGNYLAGKIPENMGNMSALESLDLSLNRLSGEIPQSMASMTFLEFLNMSFNDLVGRIPTSTQIQGFSASSFIGNKLCGPPVSANCGPDEPAPSKQHGDKQHHGLEYDDFYVSISLGYVVGLGAVIAPLLYSTAWRLYYFRWLHRVWDRLWVWTALLFRTRVAEVA